MKTILKASWLCLKLHALWEMSNNLTNFKNILQNKIIFFQSAWCFFSIKWFSSLFIYLLIDSSYKHTFVSQQKHASVSFYDQCLYFANILNDKKSYIQWDLLIIFLITKKKLTRLFILYDESVMDDYLVSSTRPFQNYCHGDT